MPQDYLQPEGQVNSLNGSKNLNTLKLFVNRHFSAENVGLGKFVPYILKWPLVDVALQARCHLILQPIFAVKKDVQQNFSDRY